MKKIAKDIMNSLADVLDKKRRPKKFERSFSKELDEILKEAKDGK